MLSQLPYLVLLILVSFVLYFFLKEKNFLVTSVSILLGLILGCFLFPYNFLSQKFLMESILVFLSIISLSPLKNIHFKITNKNNLKLILISFAKTLVLIFFSIFILNSFLQHYQFSANSPSSLSEKVILISLLLTVYSSLSSIFFFHSTDKEAIKIWGNKFSLSLIFQIVLVLSFFTFYGYEHKFIISAIKAIPITILAIILMMILKNLSFAKEDESLKKILIKDVVPINSNLSIFSFIILLCSSLILYFEANIIVFIFVTALYLSKSKYKNIFDLIVEHRNAKFIYQLIIFLSAFLLANILKDNILKNILIILFSSLCLISVKTLIFLIFKKAYSISFLKNLSSFNIFAVFCLVEYAFLQDIVGFTFAVMIVTEFFALLLQSFLSTSHKIPKTDKKDLSFEAIIGNRIIEGIEADNKNDCIGILVQKLCEFDSNLKQNDVLNAVLEREKTSHTSLNNEIAIPHCHSNVEFPTGIVGLLKKGESINWTDNEEDLPTRIVCLLVSPTEKPELHIDTIKTVIQQLNKINK